VHTCSQTGDSSKHLSGFSLPKGVYFATNAFPVAWEKTYLGTLLPDLDQPRSAGVFSFGDLKKLADELAALTRKAKNRNVLDTDELQRAKVLFYRPV